MALSSMPLASNSFTNKIPASFTGGIIFENPTIQITGGEGRIDAHEFNLDLKIKKSATANHRINGKLMAQTLDLKNHCPIGARNQRDWAR